LSGRNQGRGGNSASVEPSSGPNAENVDAAKGRGGEKNGFRAELAAKT